MKQKPEFYTQENTTDFQKKIYKLIAYKDEMAITNLLDGFFSIKNPPLSFLKAFWTATFDQGVNQEKVLSIILDKAINHEKLNVIQALVSYQITTLQDVFKATINNNNIKVLDFLLNSEYFFFNPKQKENLYLYTLQTKDSQFFYEAEEKLYKNGFELSYSIKSSQLYKVLEAMLCSENINHINYIEKKHKLDFSSNSYEYLTKFHYHLHDLHFFELPIKTQVDFLCFFIKVDSRHSVKDYMNTYFSFINQKENKASFIKVFNGLIQKNLISLEVARNDLDFFGKEDFFALFEKEHIEKKLSQSNNSKRKKVKV